MKRILTASAVATTMLFASSASAQQDKNITEYVPEGEIKKMENEKRQGWDGTLQANATVNLVSNNNVVGQTDGFSTLIGIGLLSGLDYIHMKHELRNTLSISESFARTPVLPEFVKSDDVVDLESLYSYFLTSWFGAFGRLNANTAIFQTNAITADPVNYEIARPEGVEAQTTERLNLSDSFQPFTLNESLGLFAEPVQTTPFNLSTRLGFGLRQTWAQGVLVIQDDADTEGVVEVQDLTNPDSGLTVFQGGLEGFLGLSGVLQDKRVTYDVGGSVLVPFINNDPMDRSVGELTRFGVVANVGFSVFEWMSINYKLRILRDPQLLEATQIQNNLLLTFNYTFIERTEPEAPPEPTEAEKAAEEAKEKAAAAEARAEEAEKRAAEAEKRAAEAEAAAEEAQPEPTPETPEEPETPDTPEPTPDDGGDEG